MKDEAISLEVAKKLWPEYEWRIDEKRNEVVKVVSKYIRPSAFNYTTKEGLAYMVLWLAKHSTDYFGTIGRMLLEDDPNKALAEAIRETVNE